MVRVLKRTETQKRDLKMQICEADLADLHVPVRVGNLEKKRISVFPENLNTDFTTKHWAPRTQ